MQNALLSRCRTFTLSPLTTADIISILHRAISTVCALDKTYPHLLDTEMINFLATASNGDARTALNLLELTLSLCTRPSTTKATIKSSLTKTLVYDRTGDMHYDAISAFHKSVRGSDPDATVFWLAKMLAAGEDALYIARRMIVMASEDIGLADNTMLSLATSTCVAVQQVGMPEARINLVHCAVALALAKKSTRAYRAFAGRAGVPGDWPELLHACRLYQ